MPSKPSAGWPTTTFRGSNDLEWQGFYGEERAKAILNASFTPKVPGPRRSYGSTAFDYGLSWVWDIKVHTSLQTIGPDHQKSKRRHATQ